MDIEKIAAFLQNMNPLIIEPNLCSRKITPKSSCAKCRGICPAEAITLTGNGPQVEQCVSCGLCIEACPNHVFKLTEGQLLDIDHTQTQTLILTCPQIFQSMGENLRNGVTKISCLGELYPELILYLLSSFSRVIFIHDPQECENCMGHTIEEKLQINNFSHILDKRILERLQITNDINKVKKYLASEKEQPAHNRRSFFKSIFAGSKNVSQRILDYSLNQDNIKHNNAKGKPLKMHYLKEALKKQEKLDLAQSLPYPQLKLNACNFCGACSKLCPTGALKILEESQQKKISFTPNLCTHCNICSDVCFSKGLAWENKISVEDFLCEEPRLLGMATVKECKNCQQNYFDVDSKQELCFLCRPIEELNF